jgi:hypothetical protein
MYIGAACLVLFDARGGAVAPAMLSVLIGVTVFQMLLLAMSYIPVIFHRPREVDNLCADVLIFATHVTGISICFQDPVLQFACMLHTLCHCMEQRYLNRGSASYVVFLHTLTITILLGAYVYGPRVTDLYSFVIGAACPHVMDVVAALVIRTHKVVVAYIADVS